MPDEGTPTLSAGAAEAGGRSEQFGVSAPAIALPKGGGAIKGIGEKFAANPVTGTGSMSVPIFASPGRSGFGPQLALSYDSGAGNGSFGFGWTLALPAITRKTDKGVPQYRDAEDSDDFILSGAEDLVPEFRKDTDGAWVAAHPGYSRDAEGWVRDAARRFVVREDPIDGHLVRRYRPRIEGLFARIERWTNATTGDAHWRSISRDNVTTVYGPDNDSRIFDPADPNQAHPTRIFSWLISHSYDDKGNAIVYEYKPEDSQRVPTNTLHEKNRTERSRTVNRYLKRIKYGNRASRLIQLDLSRAEWLFELVFDYEDHDPIKPTPGDDGLPWAARQDPFSSYRSGFEVRTYRLCQRVLMFHHFPDPDGTGAGYDGLVRSTDFTYSYEENKDDARNPIYSFLKSVTQTGFKLRDDGTYLSKSLPPLQFHYSEPQVSSEVRTIDATSLENLPYGIDGASFQWLDLDGEGLSGVLAEQAEGWYYKHNLSAKNVDPAIEKAQVEVELGALRLVAEKPIPSGTARGLTQFLDLAGDGSLDVVSLRPEAPGFFERTDDERWAPFRTFETLPQLDWRDPNLRFVDLTGDGHADILITEQDAFVWHRSLAEAGYGPAQRTLQALDEEKGPRLVFADGTQSIYLADMSGDGLTDLVRIRNGEVCYWPNLGHGRFGAKVAMDNAPWFDAPDQFDQGRVRVADIDGTGTTDILYLRRDGVHIFFNQSGNGWSQAQHLADVPLPDSTKSVTPLDLFGGGTACLVWSSPLPADAGRQLRYVDLMGAGIRHQVGTSKPHLLVKTENNLGAETHVHYVPSTYFYVKDKVEGRPWITRLPFPVHVVERVETYDHISRNRFVSRYAYHHGYFDGIEREFRGFGMVEQWDTEAFATLTQSGDLPVGDNVDAASHVPPVHTKTWYHTGVYLGRAHVSDFFAGLLDLHDRGEYYREPSWGEGATADIEARKYLLDDTILPEGLSTDEEREACRALRGSVLRQEVYADDGTEKAERPYTVAELNYAIRRVQPRGANPHGVFFVHPLEALTHHYERTDPPDPRTSHAMTLEVDEYGNVLKAVAIGYGRRKERCDLTEPWDRVRQLTPLVTFTENRFTNPIDEPTAWRPPLPAESRTYELTGFELAGERIRFRSEDFVRPDPVPHPGDPRRLVPVFDREINYEERPAGGVERRLIEHVRTRYRKDDLSAMCEVGQLEPLALPGESYKLAFTRGLLDRVYLRTDATGELKQLLPDAPDHPDDRSKVLRDEGGYVCLEADDRWWIPSGRLFFHRDADVISPAATAAAELASAREHFFLPAKFTDPFGQSAFATYDPHDLLVVGTEDAVGNEVKAVHDYRVLQSWQVTDPNGNRVQAAFDVLGLVAGTAVMGKAMPAAQEGDTLAGFVADLTQDELDAFIASPRQPSASPKASEATPIVHALLRDGTTRIVYDVDRFARHREPAFAATIARETHVSERDEGQQSKLQISLSYSDGFGREIQQKVQAEPGPVPQRDANGRIVLEADGQPVMTPDDANPRWGGSGWTVFNNKGKPVRQYEPFFTERHGFEFDVRVGVSPVLFYDPAGRAVATLYPNGTYAKVRFDPWQQTTWDANDTVLWDPRSDPDIATYVAEHFQALEARVLEEGRGPWQTWHQQRIGEAKGPHEREAAKKAAAHSDTPARAHADALGRTFLTVAHNKVVCPEHELDGREDKVGTRIELDIEGNQLAVLDERRLNDTHGLPHGELEQRVVMRYDHDLLGNRIHQASMDAGERWMLNDVTGKPIRSWDSRGHAFRTEYDVLRRPLRLFVTGADVNDSSRTLLVERMLYGERHPQAVALNLKGVLFKHFDQAGVASTEARDFKGNPLSTSRRLAQEYRQTVDWRAVDEALARCPTGAPLDLDTLESAASLLLEAETFTGRTTYDALNRQVTRTTPHTPAMRPSIIRPGYNEAKLLERLDVALRGAQVNGQPEWTAFITNIDYDAKGQRQRIDYGNGASTLYAYDPLTFRLVHLLTRRNAVAYPDDCPQPPRAGWPGCQVQNLRYTYDPVGNITRIHDRAQQIVYFRNARVDPSNDFTYDSIYRLIAATGREHLGQSGGAPIPHSYNDAPRVAHLHPGDGNAMGRYLEHYVYDAVGSFLSLQHCGSDPVHPGWTRTYDYKETSQLESGKQSNRLTSTSIAAMTETYSNGGNGYDAHGSMLRMPHLQVMQWNFKDQLRMTRRQAVNAADADGMQHHGERTWYVYDSAGQRVRKVTELAIGQVKDERIYLDGLEIYRKSGSNELARETLHVMDGDRRTALVETRTHGQDPAPRQLIRYQLGSHLGSTSLELNHQAEILSHEEYTPYGSTSYLAVRNETEALKRYRYSGKEREEESGLYAYRKRYYVPWLARWASCDPIGRQEVQVLYQFCNANPVNRVDMDGSDWEFCNPFSDNECSVSSTLTVMSEVAVEEVAPRVEGAFKVGAGVAGAAVGVVLCDTGVGCVLGAPLVVASADVAAAGARQVGSGRPEQTLVGMSNGPAAQQTEENLVYAAGLASFGLTVYQAVRNLVPPARVGAGQQGAEAAEPTPRAGRQAVETPRQSTEATDQAVLAERQALETASSTPVARPPVSLAAARTRAYELVEGLRARGEPVEVNIGGAGACHEPANAINLNNQAVRRWGIPNLVEADAAEIGNLFPPGGVDRISGYHMAPEAVDWTRAAPGAFRVLRSGGTFRYDFRGANADAAVLGDALRQAGFRDVEVIADVLVTAVKP